MIAQPSLGKLLVELRKQKGWTQEELVEACHVSVRTIQRIESGDVTPRESTVRLLLDALDYNSEEWKEFVQKDDSNVSPYKFLNTMLALNLPENQLKKSFHDAWLAGIIYLLLFVIDSGVEIFVELNGSIFPEIPYIAIKVVSLGTYFLFMRGMVSLATLFENRLLRVAAYLSLAMTTLYYGSDLVVFYMDPYFDGIAGVIGAFVILTNGATAIFYGAGLRRLQDGMGKAAKYAGILEIILGVCMLTLVFAPISLVIFPITMILEILILSKADDLSKSGQL
ncbi:helix-turn-helix domain-containing protein [Marinoscillum pacificum]|uniref:helix-turn-helix domain-containing protein n=1 Tax=Marinoscillum pacificum TaxID=392723 RepID=UPI002157EC71|nr:helix-turn-helix transcriptional regulator [Marinoscillum pacificum]